MGVIDTAKDIYDLVKKGATIELQEKINQIREEAINLQSENIILPCYCVFLKLSPYTLYI